MPPVVNPRAGWNVGYGAIPKNTPLTRNLWHAIKWLAPLEVAPGGGGMVPHQSPNLNTTKANYFANNTQ
jgi:hypothetical protein